MTDQRPSDVAPTRRHWLWITAGLVMLGLLIGLATLWIKAPALYGTGDAAKTATATTRAGILTVAAALIAATAAGAGLYFTARTIRINQQTLLETQRTNRATQQANRDADQRDRYAKAVEQLGSGQLDVRLGGIYGLERLAETADEQMAKRDQRTVVEVLSAYVRQHSNDDRLDAGLIGADNSPGLKPSVDVQAAVTVLGRLPIRDGVPRGDLTGAFLPGANLREARFDGVRLHRAYLVGAVFDESILAGADLRAADLRCASFRSADLRDAKIDGQEPVRLAGAQLHGSDLSGVDGLVQGHIDSAEGDGYTKLPDGLARPALWDVR